MVISRIFAQARDTPHKIAAVHNGVACRYADFARRIAQRRAFLARQSLAAGSIALIDVESMLEAWITSFALRSLGHDTLAVPGVDDPRVPRVRRAAFVVVVDDARARAATRVPSLRTIRIPASTNASGDDHGAPLAAPSAKLGGNIMMTSGTTGEYKLVVRDADAEASLLPLHVEINAMSADSVVHVANFGLWTAGGYRWPLIAWSVGATVVMHDAPDAHAPLGRHDLTHIFATPNTVAHLLRAPAGELRRNDATRLLVTGGAMPPAMLAEARERVTSQVYSVLASTEALTLSVTPVATADDLLWHRIHPSRTVEVADDDGNVLAPGREGLVRVKILDGLRGYLDDPEATRAFFREGYFYPGDLGVFGDDGRLSMRGRASDVINLFGDKIATGPLEQALERTLGVDAVCVVAIDGARGDSAIYVVIERGGGLAPADVAAAAKAELRVFRRLQIRAVLVDRLPRNAMGKIDRRVLRRELAATIEGRG